jgi:hypothetical protein
MSAYVNRASPNAGNRRHVASSIRAEKLKSEMQARSEEDFLKHLKKHDIEPVVVGPAGTFYITDHRRLARTLQEIGAVTTYCRIMETSRIQMIKRFGNICATTMRFTFEVRTAGRFLHLSSRPTLSTFKTIRFGALLEQSIKHVISQSKMKAQQAQITSNLYGPAIFARIGRRPESQ